MRTFSTRSFSTRQDRGAYAALRPAIAGDAPKRCRALAKSDRACGRRLIRAYCRGRRGVTGRRPRTRSAPADGNPFEGISDAELLQLYRGLSADAIHARRYRGRDQARRGLTAPATAVGLSRALRSRRNCKRRGLNVPGAANPVNVPNQAPVGNVTSRAFSIMSRSPASRPTSPTFSRTASTARTSRRGGLEA